MNELTFIYKDTAFTNSLIISKGAGVDHRSTYLLIEKYKAELEDFGRVSFEMIPLETNGGIQKVKVYRLNEEQATFLISLMKNTKPVVDFKKELVKQFYQMKALINTLITTRREFPLLTEQIKLLHEDSKHYHFSNECDMINRIVTGMSAKQFREKHGIAKGESIRPFLTAEQIEMLDKLQKADIGLLIAVPEYEQRKQQLERYYARLRGKSALV